LIEGRGRTLKATDPRVKARYLQDRFDRVDDKPWTYELSGRALSLALDIRERADQKAIELGGPPQFRFHHAIYGEVKAFKAHGNLAVYIEPTDDPAHSNLVILREPDAVQYLQDAAPKESHDIYRQIAALFKVCDAGDLAPLESLRRPN